MAYKQFQTLTTIRKPYIFLQMVEKRTLAAPLESKNIMQTKFRFFFKSMFKFDDLLCQVNKLIKLGHLQNQTIVKMSRRVPLSWTPDYTNVWKKIGLKKFLICHRFSSFKPMLVLLLGSEFSNKIYWLTYGAFRHSG